MTILLNTEKSSVDSNSPFARSMLSGIIYNYMEKYYNDAYEDIIILCVGTDRSTGDSLGPLTGYKLTHLPRLYPNVYVLGTLDDPVHAKNLVEKINHIYSIYNNPFVIAIDACLGRLERVGYITVAKGALKPGAGVNKDLPHIGDIHITGVVNLGGFMEYIILQNTRLSTIMRMADIISAGFITSFWKLFKEKEYESLNN